MLTQAQLAALALDAYAPAQPSLIDTEWFGWTELSERSRQGSKASLGFRASVFAGPAGPENEIVIAFRGTDTEPLANVDWITNSAAAFGIYSAPGQTGDRSCRRCDGRLSGCAYSADGSFARRRGSLL